MANLYEILVDAQHGQAMAELGREFGLTAEQTQRAVAALLPAISMGLKRSTATPEGLGDMFGLMGGQPDLYEMYDDTSAAFSPAGRAAGNAALARMYGSPEASRAVADQAQHFSGIGSAILKKLLPIVVGIIISGLMRSGSGEAAPQASTQKGGGLADILREIFGQRGAAPSGSAPGQIPDIGDLLAPEGEGGEARSKAPREAPAAARRPPPPSGPTEQAGPVGDSQDPAPPVGGGRPAPGDDMLADILRELEKGIREGRIKPVIVGPYEIDVPGQSGPAGAEPSRNPGGDIFGQMLRDLLGGTAGGGQGAASPLIGDAGVAVFGDRLEAGRDVEQSQLDSFQEVFERFVNDPRS